MYSPENKTETGPWIFNWKITKSKSLAWHGWCWFLISDFLKLRHGAYSVNDLFEKYFVGASYHSISCGMRHIVSYSKPAWLSMLTFFPPRLWCLTKNVFIQDELIAISADVVLTAWIPTAVGWKWAGKKKKKKGKPEQKHISPCLNGQTAVPVTAFFQGEKVPDLSTMRTFHFH